MASKQSSTSASDFRAGESRALPFEIDLNEIPSSPSNEPLPSSPSPASTAYEAVRTFLGAPRPAPGPPADLPTEVRNSSCVCGRSDARGATIICDACERWFHLSCAGLRSRQAISLDDWICAPCIKGGVASKRWPVGGVCSGSRGTGVRLLDINALPLSDGEGESIEDLHSHRMHSVDEKSLRGDALNASVAYTNLWNARNGFDLQGGFGMSDHLTRSISEGSAQHKLTTKRSFEETDPSANFRGRYRGTNSNTSYRRKEPARFSRVNNSTVNRVLSSGCGGVSSSDMEILEPATCNTGINARVAEVGVDGNSGFEPKQLNDGFPIQYEDFFILHLGEIDMRPSYHISSQIWPVGYRSSWHDKITGSLFTCYVLDGGSSGPIFKVKRCPCSKSLIPIGSTIFSKVAVVQIDATDDGGIDAAINSDIGFEEDDVIQMYLSVPDPSGQDMLSFLGGGLNEAPALQTVDALPSQSASLPKKSVTRLPENDVLRDEIGEFFVEGRSSSLVWTKVSETFVDACREVYKQSGVTRFFCKHELDGSASAGVKAEHAFSSLAKFCNLSAPVNTPLVICSVNELDASCEALSKWLSQDRFGLDVDFVQEIIEQLPGAHACPGYELLSKRKDYSTSVTLGSGLLMIKRKNGVIAEKDEILNDLLKGCKNSMKQGSVQIHKMSGHRPSLGRPVCSTLSAELSSDVLQVWEFLWRFGEILNLNETVQLEELETELVDPWFDDSNFLEKIEKEIQENGNHTSLGDDNTIGNILSPVGGSDPVIPGEGVPQFIKVETLSGKEASLASRTYHRCTGAILTKIHSSLLKVLVSELQAKVAALVDPTFDTGESKPRRGRRKDVDNSVAMKISKVELLPINEFTWPEMARRYILAVLSMDGNLDSSEITSREGGKVFRCLQGDGGVICGSLTGVAGMEADALLLAEASKQVYGSLKRENDVWPVEDKESDANGTCETNGVGGGDVPEWAQVLEPVRKLPTNVGTRIRKCVYDALDRGPPEWAKKILEHSISKEVYKGNASGPTKKAVISVLAEVYGEGPQQKLVKERKAKSTITKSDIIMKQCRFVLRRAAAADEAKTFCNLLGTTYLNPNENDDEGFLGSPAMVSRPLDFRTIDLRLAAGAYGGSHEAFLEDVREVWYNIRIAYGDQPELMQLAETLSENFESLYEKEVLTLVQKFREHASLESSSSEPIKELIDPLVCANDVPKAPWDEGVCKVCGIDRDDESVLLCDTCDSEYHTYCLVPPLARIPDGNWYCPSCVAGQGKAPNATTCTRVMNRRRPKRYQGERSRLISETVNHLAVTMREKEYWEFSVDERVFLLKFLCDEVLNSAILREHLDQCADMSSDLQQRLRSLQVELKNLKFKEETLAARATKESVINEVGEAGRDRVTTVLSNHGKWTEQRETMNNKSTYHMASTDTLFQLEDVPEDSKNPCGFYSKSISERHCNGSRTEQMEVSNAGNQIKDVHSVTDGGLTLENIVTRMASTTHESNRQNDQPLSTQQKSFDESVNRKLAFGTENNGSALDPEFHGSFLPLGTGRTHLTDHVSIMPTDLDKMLLGHHSVQPDANEPHDAHNLEANSLKKEILLLQDTITSTELQLLKVSMRRELLGRDSFGRLYWVLSRPGKRPWLIVDASMPSETESRESAASVANGNHPHNCLPHVRDSPSCTFYDSDCEIRQIVECLVDSDAREKELKESILQRWRPQESLQVRNHVQIDSQGTPSKSLVSETTAAQSTLFTKAATILQKRYGPWLESEPIDIPKKRGRKAKITHEDRMHRCECLELVWPSRQHCFSCHQTFPTSVELEGHNDGKCNLATSDDSKENAEPLKGKGLIRSEVSQEEHIDGVFKSEKFDVCSRLAKFLKNAPVCPYNFEEISRKFITKDSNKELVKEIGLLGSNGIPMLIPSSCPYIDDPTLILDSAQKAKAEGGAHPITREAVASQGVGAEFNLNCSDTIDYSLGRSGTIGTKALLKIEVTKLDSVGANDPVASLNDTSPDLDAGDGDIVPDSSLRLLVGKDFEILRRLKINLLDIDAALPEEALRPTKAQSARRCAWRTFVKSADTILEMVKAAIVFEDMIKTKYLRNGWWYWSSLSAAARISTLSSLAFRVYALDASIIYENASPVLDGNRTMDNPKSGKKRKESEG